MYLITCALEAEAKPIIQFYNLKKSLDIPYFYENDSLKLLVTGIGQSNALISISYFLGKNRDISSLLNIGIAGHKNLEIGSPILAHKIEKDIQAFYPTFFFQSPCITKTVTTVEEPKEVFSSDSVFDMEAFFVFQAASRFLQNDLIHSLKIISDNEKKSYTTISKQEVFSLMEKNLPTIDKIVALLSQKKKKSAIVPDLQRFCLSFTERETIKKLLAKLVVFESLNSDKIEQCQDKKQLFSYLKKATDSLILKL